MIVSSPPALEIAHNVRISYRNVTRLYLYFIVWLSAIDLTQCRIMKEMVDFDTGLRTSSSNFYEQGSELEIEIGKVNLM